MKNRRTILKYLVGLFMLFVSFILITTLAYANPTSVLTMKDDETNQASQRLAAPQGSLPLRFQSGDWPIYAQENIMLHPDPPMPGNLVELCARVVNDDLMVAHTAALQFGAAPFGIGMSFLPIGAIEILIPAAGQAVGCVMWAYPDQGDWAIEVLLNQEDAQEPLRSQRIIDANEPLQAGEANSLTFPVRNSLAQTATVTLELIPYLPDWGYELSQDLLPDMQPGETREVTLTVTPLAGQPLPPDNTPIVDVEAFVNQELIGGFRKVFRPAVALHTFPDPPYAEREITIDPYPPLAGEPTEICVELRNPTSDT